MRLVTVNIVYNNKTKHTH